MGDEEFEGRKLATVRRIKATHAIAGADVIEVAEIDGWQVVAKKGEFAAGDLCVYFEIDSFLPVLPHFEFLRKSCFRNVPDLGDGFRLKTIKLRGELSQGLALPLASLPHALADPQVGTDLTEALGVRKFEPPPSALLTHQKPGAQPHAFKPFPTFLKRTDQERIQNCFQELLERCDIGELRFEVSMKLDGSSMTAYFLDGVFGVCSRNLEVVPDPTNMFWAAARSARLEERLRHLGRNVALQGELMGPGIQQNRERVPDYTLFLFAILDIDTQHYLIPAERMALLAQLNAVPLPPVAVAVAEVMVVGEGGDVAAGAAGAAECVSATNSTGADGVVLATTPALAAALAAVDVAAGPGPATVTATAAGGAGEAGVGGDATGQAAAAGEASAAAAISAAAISAAVSAAADPAPTTARGSKAAGKGKSKGKAGSAAGGAAGADGDGGGAGVKWPAAWGARIEGIQHTPIIDAAFDLAVFGGQIAAALAFADRPSVVHAIAEGVVLKCTTHANPTFKIINNKYLLKCEE